MLDLGGDFLEERVRIWIRFVSNSDPIFVEFRSDFCRIQIRFLSNSDPIFVEFRSDFCQIQIRFLSNSDPIFCRIQIRFLSNSDPIFGEFGSDFSRIRIFSLCIGHGFGFSWASEPDPNFSDSSYRIWTRIHASGTCEERWRNSSSWAKDQFALEFSHIFTFNSKICCIYVSVTVRIHNGYAASHNTLSIYLCFFCNINL